jgi:adhesin transport system outer membrane protein
VLKQNRKISCGPIFFLACFLLLASKNPCLGQINLSLDSVVLFALNNNPDAMIAYERQAQAKLAVKEAKSLLYPQADFSLRGGYEYNDPTSTPGVINDGDTVTSGQARILVNQLLYDGKATPEEIKRRKNLAHSAAINSGLVLEKLMTDTVAAYASVWRYQSAARVSEKFVASVEQIADKVTLMTESGAESKAKKEYADSRLANAQSQLNNARANLAAALNQLENLTGRLPDFWAERPEQLDPTLRKLENYFGTAYADNSNLMLNRSDLEALKHEKRAQEGRSLPSVSLQGEARRSDNQGGKDDAANYGAVMLVMSYNLFDGHARALAEKRIESQIRENQYRQSKLQRDIKRDLRFAYNQLLAIKEEYTNTQDEITSSQSLQSLYKKQFELGEGDIINLIEGEERLHAAQIKGLRLETEMIVNSYNLLRDSGLLEKEEFCASC